MNTDVYEGSRLEEWLLHDSWNGKQALCLLAGFMPNNVDEIPYADIADFDYRPGPYNRSNIAAIVLTVIDGRYYLHLV